MRTSIRKISLRVESRRLRNRLLTFAPRCLAETLGRENAVLLCSRQCEHMCAIYEYSEFWLSEMILLVRTRSMEEGMQSAAPGISLAQGGLPSIRFAGSGEVPPMPKIHAPEMFACLRMWEPYPRAAQRKKFITLGNGNFQPRQGNLGGSLKGQR